MEHEKHHALKVLGVKIEHFISFVMVFLLLFNGIGFALITITRSDAFKSLFSEREILVEFYDPQTYERIDSEEYFYGAEIEVTDVAMLSLNSENSIGAIPQSKLKYTDEDLLELYSGLFYIETNSEKLDVRLPESFLQINKGAKVIIEADSNTVFVTNGTAALNDEFLRVGQFGQYKTESKNVISREFGNDRNITGFIDGFTDLKEFLESQDIVLGSERIYLN